MSTDNLKVSGVTYNSQEPDYCGPTLKESVHLFVNKSFQIIQSRTSYFALLSQGLNSIRRTNCDLFGLPGKRQGGNHIGPLSDLRCFPMIRCRRKMHKKPSR
jgi:hypothetical protein